MKMKFHVFIFLKSQKEADFSKKVNFIQKNKPLLNTNNDNSNINRETKLYQIGSELTFDNKKDTTINSTSYYFNNSLNNNIDYQPLRNISLNSIDDKYKYMENPFTTPEIPINEDEERRAKIIERINKNRNNRYKSQSVDKIRNNNSEKIQKREIN